MKEIVESYPISASPSDSLVPGSNDPFVALTDKLKQIKKIIVTFVNNSFNLLICVCVWEKDKMYSR